jgi:hypothetical protein
MVAIFLLDSSSASIVPLLIAEVDQSFATLVRACNELFPHNARFVERSAIAMSHSSKGRP